MSDSTKGREVTLDAESILRIARLNELIAERLADGVDAVEAERAVAELRKTRDAILDRAHLAGIRATVLIDDELYRIERHPPYVVRERVIRLSTGDSR